MSAGPDTALAGRRIAVTRPADSADELARPLAERGAIPVTVPLIRIAPPLDDAPLHAALQRLPDYDWIIFTSANAVRAIAATAIPLLPASARVAAVGPATARAVHERLGWRVDAVPVEYTGDALVPSLVHVTGERPRGRRVLWPRAAEARATVRRALEETGAVVDDPVAYRTVGSAESAARLHELIGRREVDAVTFTSPSAVTCFAGGGAVAGSVVIAVIGPVTAAAARRHGLAVHVAPAEHTIPALVESLAEHYERVGRGGSGPSARGER